MRKKIVAGNWKMNKTPDEALKLVQETLQVLASQHSGEPAVIFCPPFTSLVQVALVIKGQRGVFAGAQNCHYEKSGAFTGEISAAMVKSAGASYVIIGHSERRQYFHESDQELARKTDAALAESLFPIFCVGELLEAREAGKQEEVVARQMKDGLFHLTAEQFRRVVIAYEPVWAIGTGRVASDAQAQEMHAFIRGLITRQYGKELSDEISILYGGSCKPSNAKGLFSQADVDGGLIGGASLVAVDFGGIISAFR